MSNIEDPNVTLEEAQDAQELSYDEEWAAQWGADAEESVESSDQEEVEQEDEDADEGTTESKDETGGQEAAPAVVTPQPPQQIDPFAWIKDLPEEVKAQAEQLKHSALSDQGRVAAYNKQLYNLRQELDAAKRIAAQPAPAEQKPSASAAPELSGKFKQLKEDFPEFAEAVEELRELDRLRYEARLTEVLSPVEELRVREQQSEFDRLVTEGAKEIFPTDVPEWDWRAVSKSEDFHAWLGVQPASMQQAARQPDASEALNVLRRYKQDYDVEVAQMQLNVPVVSKSTAQADNVRNVRNKRKTASVVPGSKPVAADPNVVDGDYEAMFNAMHG